MDECVLNFTGYNLYGYIIHINMAESIDIFNVATNKSSLAVQYEELSKHSLPKDAIAAWYEMESLSMKQKLPETDIPSVLLKYLLSYVTPIIATFPNNKNFLEKVYHVNVVCEIPTSCIYNKQVFMAAPRDTIHVIGIKIPQQLHRKYGKDSSLFQNKINTAQLVANGYYGLADLQTMAYTQQRYGFTEAPMYKPSQQIITFTDNIQCNAELKKLMNYVSVITNYYERSFDAVLRDTEIYLAEHVLTERVDPPTLAAIKKNKLLDVLASVTTESLNYTTEQSLIQSLNQNNLLVLYDIGNLLGIDCKIFREIMAEKKRQIEQSIDFSKYSHSSMTAQLEQVKRNTLAFQKYGIPSVSMLTKAQLAVIDNEYNLLIKKENAKNLTSISSKLYKELRGAILGVPNKQLQGLFKKLSDIVSWPKYRDKVLSAKGTSDMTYSHLMLKDNICPHIMFVAETMSQMIGNINYLNACREGLLAHFTVPAELADYYCKICGEFLMVNNDFAVDYETTKQYSNLDPMGELIYREVTQLLTSSVRFMGYVNIKPMIAIWVQNIKPKIQQLQQQLYKSKTGIAEHIRDLISLHINIYCYALLVHFALSNRLRLQFSVSVVANAATDGAPADEKANNGDNHEKDAHKLSNQQKKKNIAMATSSNQTKQTTITTMDMTSMLNSALASLINERVVIIKRVSFNNTIIKEEFLKAFAWAKTITIGNEVLEKPIDFKDNRVSYWLNIDPFYRWLWQRISVVAKPKSMFDTDVILGASLKTLEDDFANGNDYYTHIKPEKLEQDGFMEEIVYDKDIGDEKEMSSPYLSAPKESAPVGAAESKPVSAKNYNELGNSKNYIEPNYAFLSPKYVEFKSKKLSATEIESIINRYRKNSFVAEQLLITDKVYQQAMVPMSAQYITYINNYGVILRDEQIANRYLQLSKARPNGYHSLVNNIYLELNQYKPASIHYRNYYCPNGKRHKIGAIVCDKNEYTHEEIITLINEQKTKELSHIYGQTITDFRCKLCKKLLSDVTDDNNIKKNLAKLDQYDDFFTYYANRCPKGNAHTFNQTKCTTCGVTNEELRDKSIIYYEKYSSIYLKQTEQELNEANKLINAQIIPMDVAESVAVKFPDITENFTNIAALSKLSNLNYNAIVNIGFNADNFYQELLDVNVNPFSQAAISQFIVQANRVIGYNVFIIQFINTIKNREHATKLSHDVRQIVVKLPASKDLNKKLETIIPANFMDSMQYYMRTTNARRYANYALDNMCAMLVSIHNILGNDCFKYCIDYIMLNEKLSSKPVPLTRESVDDAATNSSDLPLSSEHGDVASDKSVENEDVDEFNNEDMDLEVDADGNNENADDVDD